MGEQGLVWLRLLKSDPVQERRVSLVERQVSRLLAGFHLSDRYVATRRDLLQANLREKPTNLQQARPLWCLLGKEAR